MHDDEGPRPVVLIVALTVALGAVGAVLAVAAARHSAHRPAAQLPPPGRYADSAACRALLAALPSQLGTYERADLTGTAPFGVAAWTAADGSAPVVLSCGVDRPTDFVVGSPLQVVDDVQWFHTRDGDTGTEDASTWYAVDRPVYVALRLPANSGPTPIQVLSEVIADSVRAAAIHPGPPR